MAQQVEVSYAARFKPHRDH